MARKKKVEVTAPEEVQEEVVEQQHVVTHEDRLDSGTNWKVSDKLPSLDD